MNVKVFIFLVFIIVAGLPLYGSCTSTYMPALSSKNNAISIRLEKHSPPQINKRIAQLFNFFLNKKKPSKGHDAMGIISLIFGSLAVGGLITLIIWANLVGSFERGGGLFFLFGLAFIDIFTFLAYLFGVIGFGNAVKKGQSTILALIGISLSFLILIYIVVHLIFWKAIANWYFFI